MLFGGTDLTAAIADALSDNLVALVTVPETFPISYSPEGVRNARYSNMSEWARMRGLPWHRWSNPNDAREFLQQHRADWGLAAGWYHILPRRLRALFPFGVAGLHASLLPKYRGNAPLVWAMLNGDQQTGVSLFDLVDGVDEGGLYGQRPLTIGPRETIKTLVEAAAAASVDLVRTTLKTLDSGPPSLRPQEGEPSYCLVRRPVDSAIDWYSRTRDIDLLIRATTRPYPGAFSSIQGETIYLWAAEPVLSPRIHGRPGQIYRLPDRRTVVVTADGALEISEATLSNGGDALPVLQRFTHRAFDRP